ncbi:hypothetical protein RWE15_17730 [Virgibacillus halophilus]|uniref:Hydrolase of the HAD superfamily n=1 Tax=Tigheibacillus halophilus TaxID=361280 RepID=A0ABU5C987_9BACI|nr:hypothetical protein [Virgibacillus halophilus]
MTLKAIIFDLDDTLLWDRKSVDIALQNTSSYAAEVGGVDPERLENDVRTIAPRLYASYETYDFAKKNRYWGFRSNVGKFCRSG